jgi:hypothetical protein
VRLLDLGPNGHEHGEAWRLLTEARKLLSSLISEAASILALARSALAHVRVSHLLSAEPAAEFIAARLGDVVEFADIVEARGAASRPSLSTLLLSSEFVVRAAHEHARQADHLARGDLNAPA